MHRECLHMPQRHSYVLNNLVLGWGSSGTTLTLQMRKLTYRDVKYGSKWAYTSPSKHMSGIRRAEEDKHHRRGRKAESAVPLLDSPLVPSFLENWTCPSRFSPRSLFFGKAFSYPSLPWLMAPAGVMPLPRLITLCDNRFIFAPLTGCERLESRGKTVHPGPPQHRAWLRVTSDEWYSSKSGLWVLLLWLSGKESACQCRKWGFHPWVRKIPWRKKW